MATAQGTRAPGIAAVTTAGAVLILVALALYATQLSRAAAVAILPFAVCLVGGALFARDRGHWPTRPWLLAFALLAFAALAYGLMLYLYGQTHPPAAS